jgi:hypothetical protein
MAAAMTAADRSAVYANGFKLFCGHIRLIVTTQSITADGECDFPPCPTMSGFRSGESMGDFVKNRVLDLIGTISPDIVLGKADNSVFVVTATASALGSVKLEYPSGPLQQAVFFHQVKGELCGVVGEHDLFCTS